MMIGFLGFLGYLILCFCGSYGGATILLTSIKWSAFALWVGGNGERNLVSSENGLWRLSLAKSAPPGDGAKFLLQHLQFVRAKIAEVATAYSRRQCEGIHEVPFARVDAEFLHEVETNAAKAAKFVQILLPNTRPFFQALTEGVIFRNRHFAKTVRPPVGETHDESSLLCFLIDVRQTIPGHPEAGVGSRRFLVVVAVHLLVILGLIFVLMECVALMTRKARRFFATAWQKFATPSRFGGLKCGETNSAG